MSSSISETNKGFSFNAFKLKISHKDVYLVSISLKIAENNNNPSRELFTVEEFF